MKFEVSRDDMRTLLRNVTRAINRKTEREILSNAFVSIDDEKVIQLGCTDTETTITAHMKLVNVEEGGEITVPGLKLFEIFGSIAAGSDVKVETSENTVIISTTGKEFKLATLPPEQMKNTFLGLGRRDGETDESSSVSISLPSSTLSNMLRRTAFAMGRDQARAYLNGMLFELNDSHFRLVATEGVTMSLHTKDLEGYEGVESRIVVPNRAVDELVHLLSEDDLLSEGSENQDETVELVMNEKSLTMTKGPFQLRTNLINSSYPQYESVIPKDSTLGFTCQTNEIADAIKSANICATPKSHAIKLESNEGVLRLNSSNERGDSAGMQLPVEHSGEGVIFTVDGLRFDLLLRHVDTDQVKIHVPHESDDATNLKLEPIGDASSCFVLAQMRT